MNGTNSNLRHSEDQMFSFSQTRIVVPLRRGPTRRLYAKARPQSLSLIWPNSGLSTFQKV